MIPFDHYEARIDAVRALHPDMPYANVMLLRLVTHLARGIQEHLDQLLASHGLTSTAWSVLMSIYSAPEATDNPSRVSQAVCLSRPHMTRLTDELVAGGWVERVPSTTDRRSIEIRMTADGLGRVRALFPEVWALYEDLTPAGGPEAVSALADCLRGWTRLMEQQRKDGANAQIGSPE
ncbi:MarR family transcriptional regulator [Niveibacterium sp. 24ML]|uniref:MarR family winged helix-turn-helix transcriptional regulator n=1 Tax=Niveibacterium sp. 24ML TaxID=2985512 RepID=UPI00226D7C95|nr:MarR family transcriptional regulator [Niveibacterium sp. 24ML]MCX9157048.1 MarR family transcriptional regulator [Niveibacterium sp. 24ML]